MSLGAVASSLGAALMSLEAVSMSLGAASWLLGWIQGHLDTRGSIKVSSGKVTRGGVKIFKGDI